MNTRRTKWRAGLGVFFVGGFLILAGCPLALKAIHLAPSPLAVVENRELAVRPELDRYALKEWPKVLDAYFKDQLAFRSHLLAAYIRVWEQGFEAPVKRYATGKGGEFILHHVSPVLASSLGLLPLSREEQAMVKLSYVGMNAYFEQLGIPYVVVFIPDKTTLYPGIMPFWSTWRRGKNLYDQLFEVFNSISVHILDLSEALKNNSERVYNIRYDAEHWNGEGIRVSHDATISYLKSNINMLSDCGNACFHIVKKEKTFSGYEPEKVSFISIKNQETYENLWNKIYPESSNNWDSPKLITRNSESGTLWMLTDSYFMGTHTETTDKWRGNISPLVNHVKNYLHMHYAFFDWKKYHELVKSYRPDVVVEAFAERTRGNSMRAHEPRIRILADLALRTPAVILAKNVFSTTMLQNIKPSVDGERVVLDAVTADPMLVFPPVKADADGRAVVMARFIAPADTHAQLFFAEGAAPFSEQQSMMMSVKAGENLVHLHAVATPHAEIRLRFDPGAVPGRYIFLPFPTATEIVRDSHGL